MVEGEDMRVGDCVIYPACH